MKYRILFILSLVFAPTACIKVNNSSSGDYILKDSSAEFVAAFEIMKAKCFRCHHDFNNLSEAKLLADNWVVKQDPNNSEVFYRIKNSSGSLGPKNMPPDTDLSTEERDVLKAWINSIP